MGPSRLLVVEDDVELRNLVENRLREAGYIVDTAGTGTEALERVANAVPDLVLLDLRLPKVDGLEVLNDMKQVESLQAIPVVVMTASENEADRLQCKAANVDAYLSKPMDLPKFLSVVEQQKPSHATAWLKSE